MPPLYRDPLARQENSSPFENEASITLQAAGLPRLIVYADFSAIGDAGGGDGGFGGNSSRLATLRRAAGGGEGTGATETEGSEAVAVAGRDTTAVKPFVDLNDHDGVGDLAVGPYEGLPIT